jgi:hypothetical protein
MVADDAVGFDGAEFSRKIVQLGLASSITAIGGDYSPPPTGAVGV